jgi:H+/Na+-translocating ferredoxin:NAD+ oxidoreductase subunit D
MALLKITSPHATGPLSTAKVMQLVLVATLPGILALSWYFGWGMLINIIWACVVAVAAEALALTLRKRPLKFYLADYSAIVTAVLIAIAMPPYSPWWLILIGVGFAILVAKHLYGGLGYNPFNPAMVGYVVLLISFPIEMTIWATPRGALEGSFPSLIDSLGALWLGRDSMGIFAVDGITMATPLDILKQNQTLLIDDLWAAQPQFGRWGGMGWEWVNLGFLTGGLFLLSQRVFTWHAPISMLISLAIVSALFYDAGSSASGGSPLFHLLSGATMLGAFFIVTDPVTSAASNIGRVIYGALIGILVYLIRVWGNYPDAVAFSVLLMNFAAPLLDHYTQPRTYGHAKSGEHS